MSIIYRTKNAINPDSKRPAYQAKIESYLSVMHLQLPVPGVLDLDSPKFIIEGGHRFIETDSDGNETIGETTVMDTKNNTFTYDEVIAMHPQAKTIIDAFMNLMDGVFIGKIDADKAINWGLGINDYEKYTPPSESEDEGA